MAAEAVDRRDVSCIDVARDRRKDRPQPWRDQAVMLLGSPASAGKARGRARVLRAPADLAAVQLGEVVVVESPSPAWVPALALAAAVVADSGRALSDLALAARERGTPAVVGTGLATAMIRDGQLVDVDGGTGVVRVVAPALERAVGVARQPAQDLVLATGWRSPAR